MERLRSIRDALIETCHVGDVQARVRGASGRDALRALITEIDRTVLPRRVTAHFDDGTDVHLIVSNRRLHRVMGEKAPFEAIGDRDLEPDDAHPTIQTLSAIGEGRCLTNILADPEETDPHLTGLGISTARLFLSAGLESSHRQWAPAFANLTALVRNDPQHLYAAFEMTGEEVASTAGSDEAIEQCFDEVLALLQSVTDPEFALAQTLATEGMIITPHPMLPDGCLAVIGTPEAIHVALFNGLAVPDLWNLLRQQEHSSQTRS